MRTPHMAALQARDATGERLLDDVHEMAILVACAPSHAPNGPFLLTFGFGFRCLPMRALGKQSQQRDANHG